MQQRTGLLDFDHSSTVFLIRHFQVPERVKPALSKCKMVCLQTAVMNMEVAQPVGMGKDKLLIFSPCLEAVTDIERQGKTRAFKQFLDRTLLEGQKT